MKFKIKFLSEVTIVSVQNFKYSKIDIDDSFPEYIQQNKDKFSEWIAE